MNTTDVLMDPKIFVEPEKFVPERWLTGSSKNKTLDKYLVPFSKGPRGCIGLWLAYAGLYTGTAAVFSNFDFELFETDERNVIAERDHFSPFAKPGFEEFKVLVKRAED